MTTVANIKGYINGAEWGVYNEAPSLLDYEDVIAAATSQNINNLIAELNQHSVEYYNKFLQNNLNENTSNELRLGRGFKEDPMQGTVREYWDYIGGYYTSYESMSMGDQDINAIIYDNSSSQWKTKYIEG